MYTLYVYPDAWVGTALSYVVSIESRGCYIDAVPGRMGIQSNPIIDYPIIPRRMGIQSSNRHT